MGSRLGESMSLLQSPFVGTLARETASDPFVEHSRLGAPFLWVGFGSYQHRPCDRPPTRANPVNETGLALVYTPACSLQ